MSAHLDATPLVLSETGVTETVSTVYQETEPVLSEPKITMSQGVIVLLNTMVGVGILSVPLCYRIGVLLNTLLIVVMGLFAFISFVLLVDASRTTGCEVQYSTLMKLSFARDLSWIPDSINFIMMFGVAILHLQYSAKIIDIVLNQIENCPAWLHNPWFLVMAPLVVVDLPLMFLKSIRGLSSLSMFTGVLIIVFLIHCAVYLGIYVHDGGLDPEKKIVWFEFNEYFIQAISIQAFAFTCHPVIGSTVSSLENPTPLRTYGMLALVVFGATVCYVFGGLTPYLTLVDKVTDTIVFKDYLTDHPGQIFTLVTTALFGVFLTITTPLILFAARFAFNELVFRSEFTTMRWNLVGVCVLFVGGVIAVTVDSIGTMFGFIGGVTCTIVVYVLPSIYYLRLCNGESRLKTILSWVMMPVGIVILSVCLYDSIRGLVA